MPTNRTKRTRNRRLNVTGELEKFFITGQAERGSDVVWDIFANEDRIYQAWEKCKHLLRRQCKKVLAWSIFETQGSIKCFPEFCWISRDSYLEWKENNVKHDAN